jgi:chromosome partitioning protein
LLDGLEDAMRILVLASAKGGVGKSTLSAHLAIAAEAAGVNPVVLVDTDPQASLAKWWNKRRAETPGFAGVKGDLFTTLKQLAEAGIALVIIDTPPSLSASIDATVSTADLVLIPVTPSPIDLEAVGSTVDIVNRAKRQRVFVVNKARRNSVLTADIADALQRHGDVVPVLIEDRLDYRTGMIQGKTAQEYAPKGKAATEMRDLWGYVAEKLA